MNKVYCSNVTCAKPNYYEAGKPKFCAHCGQSFSSGFMAPQIIPAAPQAPVSPAPVVARASVQPRIVVQTQEEPELDFSNFKITIAEPPKKLTLGQIQSNAAFVPSADRPVGNQTDAEAVLRENIRRARHVNRDTEGE